MTVKLRYIRITAAVLIALIIMLGMPVCAVPDAPCSVCAVSLEDPMPFDLDCASAVLMEAETGTVLYNKNGSEPLPPASVTKVMTLLLVMEAIDDGKLALTDKLTVSEYAASMGGSQVYLEPGEEMTVEDLIKSVVISSANDAAVTLAEAVAGSETAFINMMNERAASLGMSNTRFENATGLDDTAENHVTSALDIAIMSRALIAHPLILQYSSIWMDSIRDGAFGLTNTNRLIRFYSGATGLKTGSTSKAKFCISATACRDGMHLIAVIMGAPTRDIRNEAAKKLLDHGFANYAVYRDIGQRASDIKVMGGVEDACATAHQGFSALLSKGEASKVSKEIEIDEYVKAPVKAGDIVGKVRYSVDGKMIGSVDVVCIAEIEKIGFFKLLGRMLASFSLS